MRPRTHTHTHTLRTPPPSFPQCASHSFTPSESRLLLHPRVAELGWRSERKEEKKKQPFVASSSLLCLLPSVDTVAITHPGGPNRSPTSPFERFCPPFATDRLRCSPVRRHLSALTLAASFRLSYRTKMKSLRGWTAWACWVCVFSYCVLLLDVLLFLHPGFGVGST